MRDIADKFVGGIERIDAEQETSRRGLSWRAILLGLLGVAAISIATPYNNTVLENTPLIGNHLPVSVLFGMLMMVLVVNPVLMRLPRASSPVDPASLLVRWICVLPISLFLWRGPVDVNAPELETEGLAGLVAGTVWFGTGILLTIAALVGQWRPSLFKRAAVGHLLLITLIAILPVLTPVLVRGMDTTPGAADTPMVNITLTYVGVTIALFLLGGVIERWLKRIDPFSAGELTVMMTMMLVACVAPASGFHRLWAHQLVAPFYHLPGHPRWQPLVEALPDWLVPSADPQNVDVVYNFYAGRASVPWGPWIGTALRWSPFVLAFLIGSFFLMSLLRRQWEEAEKLPFPLATIALEILRPPSKGRLLNDMFRNKLFWWTVTIVVAGQTFYGLHYYFPDVPEIVFKYKLHSALEQVPWRHLPEWLKAKEANIAVIGVTFFLATEMSFSLWAFVIILAGAEMLGKQFQYPVHEQFDDHQIGAYIAYAAVILWVARRHLWLVFKSIGKKSTNDSDDQVRERTAAIGFLVCFAVIGVWLYLAGLPPIVAVLVDLTIFILSLVIGRVVAESGLLFVQYKCGPHLFAESAFPQLLTPRTHALTHFTTIASTMDQREGLLPYAFNSARMADGVERMGNRRWLFVIWIGCVVLALVLAGAAHLSIVYEYGAANGDLWAGQMLPEDTYNSSADLTELLDSPANKIHQVRKEHGVNVTTGAGITLGLCALRYRFLAWPLHPIGFVMANTVPMQVFWLSILIGWACKSLVMRLGGVPLYRKLAPMFLGMIVATTFSSIFWILVKVASYSGGHQGEAILFFPS